MMDYEREPEDMPMWVDSPRISDLIRILEDVKSQEGDLFLTFTDANNRCKRNMSVHTDWVQMVTGPADYCLVIQER